MTTWFSDGTPVDALDFDDRAWQFGDGVFETIAVRNNAARFLDWHIERALTGCRRLGIEAPVPEKLQQAVLDAVDAAPIDTDFALLKLVVTAAGTPRGYRRAVPAESRHYAGVFASAPVAARHYEQGVRVRLCNTRIARQPQLAGIKSLNRLEQVLARNEWDDDGIFEGLTFDTDGRLICGTMSNVFIVEDNALVTPDLSHAGVAGIMRRKLIETADEAGAKVEVAAIDRERLAGSAEVMLCNSQFGILPVRDLDGRELMPGAITRQLMRAVRDAGVGDIAC